MTDHSHEAFIERAIDLARKVALEERTAGPFGAVIVRGGEIIAEGVNAVLGTGDPTCHAEMAAIRAAAKVVGGHVLTGCVLYTSSEPCPMCYGAAWWARIEAIWYAGSVEDASRWGDFDDRPMYDALTHPGPERPLPCRPVPSADMNNLWHAFNALPDRVHY